MANNKPVVFLAFANDRDDQVGYLRNLPEETRRLRDVLRPAEQAGLCQLVIRSNCTADDIFKVFQDPEIRDRVAIFHYGGHANGYQLLLESASGNAAAADAGGLAAFLAQQRGLQLVFLNGCSTQQQTQGLLEANVASAISTSRSIDDEVATDFSSRFYRGLAGGANIRTAYHEAEAAVQTAHAGNTRAAYFGDQDDSPNNVDEDRWPWNLSLREGAENADRWNLPEAASDPLFGLPPLAAEDLPETPFRHLDRFTREDAELFFGRGRQIRELYDRLTAPATPPILLFYGQSGVGKSSLLDAGLFPRLEHDHEVRYLRRTEGGLRDTLELAFLPEAMDVPIETAWRVKEEQLGKPLIVFLDQVEELFSRPRVDLADELEQLLDVVRATFIQSDRRPQGKLVLGFRKEWLAELESQLADYQLPRTKVFLEPLDRRGIIEVVQGPAESSRLRERYGLTVEQGLAETIADDLLADRDSAIAPTLQILLTKMWAKATQDNYQQPQFSHELYQDLKRKGILLRDFLDQQMETFRQLHPRAVDSGLLLDLIALHTTPLGTADQLPIDHLRQQYAHLEEALPDLLQQCQDLHLLTIAVSVQKESSKATRLAHDTLAPLVREQFDLSDKPGQRARRILDNRSVDWAGDQEGTPLDEADLGVVEKGIDGTRTLSPTERRLLDASRKLRTRLRRTRAALSAASVTGVAIITITAVVAWWQWGVAETAKLTAVEEQRKAEANLAMADTNRGLARELMTDFLPEVTSAADTELAMFTMQYFDDFASRHRTNDPPFSPLFSDAKYLIGAVHLDADDFIKSESVLQDAFRWQYGLLKRGRPFEPHGPLEFPSAQELASIEITSSNEGQASDLGYTLNALGKTYLEQGDALEEDAEKKAKWAAAKDRYAEAAVLRKMVAAIHRDQIEHLLSHASSEMNIGLASRRLGDTKLAQQQFGTAKRIRQELQGVAARNDLPLINRHLALGDLNWAVLIRKAYQGSAQQNQEDHKASQEEAEQLVTNAIDLCLQSLANIKETASPPRNSQGEFPRKLSLDDFDTQALLANSYFLRGKIGLEQLSGEAFDDQKFTLGGKPLWEQKLTDDSKPIQDFTKAESTFKTLFHDRKWVAENRARLKDVALVLSHCFDDPQHKREAWEKVQEYWKTIKMVDRSNVEHHNEETKGYLNYLERLGFRSLRFAIRSRLYDEGTVASEQIDQDEQLWRTIRSKLLRDENQAQAEYFLAALLHMHAGMEANRRAYEDAVEAMGLWSGLMHRVAKSPGTDEAKIAEYLNRHAQMSKLVAKLEE